MRYELMRPSQIREAIKKRTPVVLPLGVLEYHSEHLPVGMDTLAVVHMEAYRLHVRDQLQTSIGPLTPIWAGARFWQPSLVMAIGFSQRRPNVGEVTNVSIWNVMFGSSG